LGIRGIFPKIYERVNETYRNVNDIDLGYTQKYMPIKRTDFKTEEVDMLNANQEFVSTHHGSLKERRVNKNDIDLHRSIDDVVLDYVMQMEHYIAFAEPLKDITRIIGDKEVQRTIRVKNGNYLNRIINGFLQDFATNGIDSKNRWRSIAWIRKNFITASLGINPVVMLKAVIEFSCLCCGCKSFCNFLLLIF